MKDIQPSFYAIIPANVRYDKELTPNAKLLYGEITALCNKEGYCWASNDYFATLYSVSKTSISKWISQLVSKRYLSSRIIYKTGTKEIEARHLTIVIGGDEEKLNTPIEEKLIDNNTGSINTFNNTDSYILDFPDTNKKNEDLYPFDDFWDLYDKKRDKIACEKKWAALTQKEKKEAMSFIPKYKASQPDSQYRKDPIRFLKNKTWNDELDTTQLFPKDSLQAHTIQQPVPSNTDWREREKYWEEQTRLERQQLK